MVSEMKNMLEVQIGQLTLRNPLILASGTAGFGSEMETLFGLKNVGAIVTKTITIEPRIGNHPPRVCETPCGMLNSIGLANPGLITFKNDTIPELKKLDTRIIVSVGGENEDDYCEIINELRSVSHISAFELNLSCPNVVKGGINLGKIPKIVQDLVYKLKSITDKPLWSKLSPQTSDILSLSLASQAGGAEAVVIANTIPGMAINIWTREPMLGGITGGLSGAAIHPVAVALIYTLRNKLEIPIVGSGGITNPEDAIELILAGAHAVQLGSGNFIDSLLPIKMIEFMKEYLKKCEYNSIKEIVGKIKLKT